ncbi:substrate-binding periplasmic protein [Deefgea rivuli]|uniref:substrate-binding periplasmic protein n=1 Tax=Deefgea rivuli TaxID=400948 RepID=UPI000483938F|nr:transporter substrate-binding domain-containing protein [Deefgea rivuli]
MLNLICFLCLILLTHSCWAAPQQIELANGEWSPLLGENLPNNGYASQIVRRAFALEKIKVNYKFYPWKRSLEEARAGKVAGTLLWTSNADRQKDFLISQPVYSSRTVLFFHRDRPLLWQYPEDLKGGRFGITNGYSYGKIWEALLNSRVLIGDQANTDTQNFAKLLAKRIDGFPCEEVVGIDLLRHQLGPAALQKINISPKTVHEEPLYLLISRKTPGAEALMQRFNRGLTKMHGSGELAEILKVALQR